MLLRAEGDGQKHLYVQCLRAYIVEDDNASNDMLMQNASRPFSRNVLKPSNMMITKTLGNVLLVGEPELQWRQEEIEIITWTTKTTVKM
jgi:hypothetical protein